MATQQDVIAAIENLKIKTNLLHNAYNVPLSSLATFVAQAQTSSAAVSAYAAGGTPPITSAPSATMTLLKAAMTAAPVNHAAIPTTSVGTFVAGTAGDGLNPIRIPGAGGTFTRLWIQNAANGNGGKTATLRNVTKVETLASLGPAVGGLAEFTSPDGSSKTKVWSAGGAWSTTSGSIADFCIGFTLTNARGFGIAGRLDSGMGHVYVSENGGPLTLCAQRMVWSLQDSYNYMDFGSVGTRNIVWVGKASIETGELAIPSNATVAPYDWTAGKFLYSFLGDSWGQTNESVKGFSLPQATGKLLGASHIVGSTIGGTGFIADTGGSQPPGTNATRLAAWTSGSPSILDCSLIVNDNIANQAALRTAVDTVLTTGRTNCPNALIIVTLWNSQGSRSTNKTGNEYIKMTIIRERARLMTGKWIIINAFDGIWETSDGTVKSVASGPMITGEGSAAGPTGTGNADTWIDEPGGRHPTSIGVIGIANYKAAMIKEAIASMTISSTAPAPSPAPAPAPTTTSSFVAGQQQTFTLTDTTAIKYGNVASNAFYQLTLAPGTYTCGDSVFGDAAPGLNKSCYLVGTDASSPPLSPNAPTTAPAPAPAPSEPSAGTSTVVALLHLNEVAVSTRSSTWVNSVPGGAIFNNWGSTKSLGGNSGSLSPWGTGATCESVNGSPCAITSASMITFSSDLTFEGYVSELDPDRELFQFSTNGTNTGNMRIRLVGQKNGTNYSLVLYVKNGTQDFVAFTTPTLIPATVGGLANSFHWALQRESNIFTLRVNGQLISTATVPVTGSLTGYLDLFGSYDRVNDSANGMYRAKVSELRASNIAVYSGLSYTIPTTRFSNPTTSAITPGPITTSGFIPKGVVFEGDSITAGVQQNTSPYPTQYSQLTGIPITNVALSGDKLILMRNGFNNDVAPLFNVNNRDTFVINGGTNDLAGDNTSAATLESYMRSIAASAKAAGFVKVFVSTITPRGLGTAQEAIRTAFNSAMMTKWPEFCDGCIDFSSAVPFNGTNYFDGLHPSNAASALMAAEVQKTFANTPSVVSNAGVADLTHIMITGASQETDALGGGINVQSSQVIDAQSRILAATGKNVVIHQYAVSGTNVAHLVSTQWPQIKAAHSSLGGNGKVLVVLASGGNDITPNVPITLPNQHLINQKAALLGVIAEIEALGWDWCLSDLTFRDYASPTYQLDRTKGSWAWVTAVSKAINATRQKLWGRNWVYADGTSWLNAYSLTRNNRQMLVSDGIHHTDPGKTMYRNFLVDNVFVPAITGVPAIEALPRDETFPLVYTINGVTVSETTLVVSSMATHQGTSHIGVYASGSTPTAAQVVAGNGTGFVSKTSATRDGTLIDKAGSQTVSGLSGGTTYAIKAVFVSDAGQTSAVITSTGTTSTSGTTPAPAPASTMFMLLHLNEPADATRAAQFVNSVSTGPAFNNWGSAQSSGARVLTNSLYPFGKGFDAESANGAPIAVTSVNTVSVPGVFTIQGFMDSIDQDRELMQISTDGTDDGACRIRLVGVNDNGKKLRCYIKLGSIDIEAFQTDVLVPGTVAGMPSGYHWALQRESNNIVTLRVNGALVGTSSTATPGTITGYLDAFGSYNRVDNSANGMFRAKVSEIRGDLAVLYTGQNYTVPTARFS